MIRFRFLRAVNTILSLMVTFSGECGVLLKSVSLSSSCTLCEAKDIVEPVELDLCLERGIVQAAVGIAALFRSDRPLG